MKYWLDIPASELSRQWLLDEHRSIHAYFGWYKKDKPFKHSIFEAQKPEVLKARHEELVNEMAKRGYNHKTPL